MSFWEAVDSICLRTGNRLRPHYDLHTPGIIVTDRRATFRERMPAQCAQGLPQGARRVFIEELNYDDQRAELTHGFQINLQFTWEDRVRVVGYATQPGVG